MRHLLTILFCIFAMAIESQTLKFHHFSVKTGLPHNSILALQQDAKGRIWIATMEGLVVFDGKYFYPANVDNIANRRVDRIYRDDSANIWVRCAGKENLYYKYDTLHHAFNMYDIVELGEVFVQKLKSGYKRSYLDPYSSKSWVLDKHIVWQIDSLNPKNNFSYTGKTATDAGLHDNSIYSIFLDNQGILWVGSANNGLFFADSRPLYYQRLVCMPTPMVRSLTKDHNGNIYIAISDKELICIDSEDQSVYKSVEYAKLDTIEGRRIRTLVNDNRHHLWMGTRDGLYLKPANIDVFKRINFSDGKQQRVYSICQDKSNQIWVGTSVGLFRVQLNGQQTSVVPIDTTLAIVHGMASSSKGLWLSTENGLYCHTDSSITKLTDDFCYAMAIDIQENVWTGTSKGLRKYNVKTGINDSIAELGKHTIQALVCYKDFIWCSFEDGICCVNTYTGKITFLYTAQPNEYLENSAYCDVANGLIYFGGTQGIDCFNATELDARLRAQPNVLWLEEVVKHISPAQYSKLYIILSVFLVLILSGIVFVILLWRNKKNVRSKIATNTDKHKSSESSLQISPFIKQANLIMHNHISDTEFTASEFAAEMAMSRTKFFNLMKAETGKTVMEFVRDARLSHACDMLLKGLPVSEVALKCGFNDNSNFRRVFNKKYGVSPSQFKNSKQNNEKEE